MEKTIFPIGKTTFPIEKIIFSIGITAFSMEKIIFSIGKKAGVVNECGRAAWEKVFVYTNERLCCMNNTKGGGKRVN